MALLAFERAAFEAATGKTIIRARVLRAGVVAGAYEEGPVDWKGEEPLEA